MEPIILTLILVIICLALNVYAIKFNTGAVKKVKPEVLADPVEQKQRICFQLEYYDDDHVITETDQFTVEPGEEITVKIRIISI